VDKVLLVSEHDLALAILRLVELEKAVVEGAGAAGLAAALQEKDRVRGRRIAVILCGANVDHDVFARVLG
jgi:threonine dehydratase